jgi:hypothetical protein
VDSSNELMGNWIVDQSGRVVGDEAEQQIRELIGRFTRLGERACGWTTLYRNPSDGSFWERTFPRGAMQGGGPAKLTRLTTKQVSELYPALDLP